MSHKIVVVGSGTAGTIAAAYIKRYWGEHVSVALLYDRSIPPIGVGESTTPFIFNFLNRVGISFQDLVKATSSTVKLGIKFKNWRGDGGHYFHNFVQPSLGDSSDMGAKFAAKVAEGSLFEAESVDPSLLEDCKLPYTAYSGGLNFAVHLDSNEFSRYVERTLGDDVEIVDGRVKDVALNQDGTIEKLVLDSGVEVLADFFIDATGSSRTLISRMDPTWRSVSGMLPVDRAIPNPVPRRGDHIEPYTLAEATANGWIWQVPLSSRYGTGYVYSSQFTSDAEAREDFSRWLAKNHNVELLSDRIIEFDCGFFEDGWRGNCLAVGLSSGFIEPLESTSIHITTLQVREFCMRYTLRNLRFDRDNYNEYLTNVWQDTAEFVRFHYFTDRQDSDFWRYISSTTPQWATDIREKLSSDMLNPYHFKNSVIFEKQAWGWVGEGLGMCNREAAERYLHLRNLKNEGLHQYLSTVVSHSFEANLAVDHAEFIKFLASR